MELKLRKYDTPYRLNTGRWEDSRPYNPDSPELTGTPKVIAQEIVKKLRGGRVVLVEVGGLWAIDTLAIAANFRSEIEAGNLTIIVTNKEQFDTDQGITNTSGKRWISKLNAMTELPDERGLQMVAQYKDLVHFVSGVEIKRLPRILNKLRLFKADVIIEHFGGLFHTKDKKAAIEAVSDSLNKGGVIITHEHLLDQVKYGDIGRCGLQGDKNYRWGEGSHQIYRKIK